MPSFQPPPWASQPCRTATVEVQEEGGATHTQPVDKQPWYLFGRDASACDVPLDHPTASRQHAALVHHSDGRVFVIDLGSTHGTTLDGARLPPNKPTVLKNGAELRFGQLPTLFVVRDVESSGEKRARGDGDDGAGSGTAAAAAAGGDGAAGGGSGAPSRGPRIKPEREGTTVRCAHLLVKHKDVRRPRSWKEDPVTRTKEEALAMIEEFRARLVAAAAANEGAGPATALQQEFEALAAVESHCSSAKRGGDLGPFGPGQMQAAFEDATYALAVGELSGPIFSDSGVHLILRTG